MYLELRPNLPLVEVSSRAMWRAWLAAEHDSSQGVWAVTVKKAALQPGEVYVSAVDLNEECLCFGWIDSRPAKIDERRTALLCTPRKPGSGWSKVNKSRLERLMEQGRIAPAGLAAIQRAKQDGSWSKLDAVDALDVPDDLRLALESAAGAAAYFDRFPPSVRRGILEWIASAKTASTRVKRIAETAREAQQNRRANQWPRGGK